MAHSNKTRAAVVAALLAGHSSSSIARHLKIPKSTVCRFRRELSPEQLEKIGPEARAQIDELLLDLLRANLEALTDIATFATEPETLRGQPLESIALLYREIAEPTVRIIEAALAAGVGR